MNLVNNPRNPLLNRALRAHYPPGSVIKPLIAIVGLESGIITPTEIISCPPQPPPAGWPSCLAQSRSHACHDWWWDGQGGNIARNAIKGSCNIYFSRLAERIPTNVLQRWLFRFGYGRQIALTQPLLSMYEPGFQLRTLRQAPGQIASRQPHDLDRIFSLLQTGPLNPGDRRLAGIGQGPIRVTPLQVANSIATLARNGQFLPPRLFKTDSSIPAKSIDLEISPTTLALVLDGMYACVNETNGTARSAFAETYFKEQGIQIYGKTGSTEGPENAWFAGFAKDAYGHCIALAVVVEGGQSGSHDAAPLGREMIQFCLNHKYLSSHTIDVNNLSDPNRSE
jgi:penicillin-binding protein 2